MGKGIPSSSSIGRPSPGKWPTELNFISWKRRTWRLRTQYDLNGTRHHRSRCKAIFVNKRTREGSVPRTRCRIPGLLFLFPFPDQPTVQYVRHVCLKNIFFSEDLLYELLFPSARGELLFARKQDWINVICNVAQESRKRICVVRTGQK